VEKPVKRTIKVIKKGSKLNDKPATQPTPARGAAREMVKTVTNWVNEIQQKRRAETANAIKVLISETPRPSEI
jgi:hypothetical protein